MEDPVLAFIGPSRSGKSTVVRELHHRGPIEVSRSWTTRPRRDDELGDTIEHRFVTEEEFTDRETAGCFLEVVRPFGLPYRYGLPAVEPASPNRVRDLRDVSGDGLFGKGTFLLRYGREATCLASATCWVAGSTTLFALVPARSLHVAVFAVYLACALQGPVLCSRRRVTSPNR